MPQQKPVAQMGLYTYGDQIKTSLHGRLSGLDANGYCVGAPGNREPLEIWTAGSTASAALSTATLAPGGISIIQPATASTFAMPGPSLSYLGMDKTYAFISTGGGNIDIVLKSGNFQTSVSSTYTKLSLTTTGTAQNGSMYFQCLSTAYWTLSGTTNAAGSGSTHLGFS